MCGFVSPFGKPSPPCNPGGNLFSVKPSSETTSPFGMQTGASIFGGTTSVGMFGTTQSSGTTSPFGVQTGGSVFGGTTSADVFGTAQSSGGKTSHFGLQNGGSVFGGTTSAGVFGTAQSSGGKPSPFGVQNGGSVFRGTTSADLFGTKSSSGTTSPFGLQSGGSIFSGMTSAGVFGTKSSAGTSPFGPLTEGSVFGGTSSVSLFGTTQSYGITTSPFGVQTEGSVFGGNTSAGVFGTTQSSDGTTSPFGVQQIGGSFLGGTTSASVFGTTQSSGGLVLGGTSTGVFGATHSSSPIASTSTFGIMPPFGASPTLPFGSSIWGQKATHEGFGKTSCSFGSASQQTQSTFRSSGPFGSTIGGTTTAFGPTWKGLNTTTSTSGRIPPAFPVQGKGIKIATHTATTDVDVNKIFVSISAMPAFKDKSHEELRWEDYQPGGQNSSGQRAGFTIKSSPFDTTPKLSHTSLNLSFTPTCPNPFAPQKLAVCTSGFTPSSTAVNFSSSSFPGLALNLNSPLGATPAISKPPCSPQSSSLFPSAQLPEKTSASFQQTPATGNGINNTPLIFNSSFPVLNPSASTFNLISPLGTTSAISKPLFPSAQLPEKTSASFQQTPAAVSSIWGGVTPVPDQATCAQRSSTPSTGVVLLPHVMNPFGTLPAMPQLSVGRSGFGPSTQYGISNMPVTEKPAPVRASTFLISRHLSQRRTELAAMKYHPKKDDQMVPFFWDDEEKPAKPKADAFVIARENPRALLIHPIDKQWSSKTKAEKMVQDNGKSKEKKKAEPEPDGELLMPKLQHSDYYTEPEIHELKEKERVEPGFCSHVKEFVVGRYGYGSMKFVEEIDVRQLDLESIVEFNNREVIVYMDESKKPPVGQGLNKAAEVTLLNIKCLDKMTGEACTDGAKVDRFREMLEKKPIPSPAPFFADPFVPSAPLGQPGAAVELRTEFLLLGRSAEPLSSRAPPRTCSKIEDPRHLHCGAGELASSNRQCQQARALQPMTRSPPSPPIHPPSTDRCTGFGDRIAFRESCRASLLAHRDYQVTGTIRFGAVLVEDCLGG